jgi:perosamine synthetase
MTDFNFIPVSKPTISQKEIDYVLDAVQSGWVSSLGKYIDIFEQNFADYCGTKYAVSTSNGTNALHLALESFGIGPGDEVIIPDLTFIATANAVKYTGANVITVDIEEDSLCINVDEVKKAITEKTKAIIPVHLYGHPASMIELNKIAEDHNLIVIEDAAEAHGAEINSIKVGSFGNAGIFSFYGNKVLTTGEGGMVTTNDKYIYERLKFLRDHAMHSDKRYWHEEIGFNYRMTNLQAALGAAQLERIDEILDKKKKIFEWYEEYLYKVKKIKLNSQRKGYKNVFWVVCVEIKGLDQEKRDSLIDALKFVGIDSRPFFYPVSEMPMYQFNDTKITHLASKTGLNLPSFFDITKEEVVYICENLKKLIQ